MLKKNVGVHGIMQRAVSVLRSYREFKLRIKAKGVPKGSRGKAVRSVMDLKVSVIYM